jgi:hypothetical protein
MGPSVKKKPNNQMCIKGRGEMKGGTLPLELKTQALSQIKYYKELIC